MLIVLTSHEQLGSTGKETGYYLPELTHPLYALLAAGYKVDIASPKGGKAPMDPKSKKLDDPENKKFVEDPKMMEKVEHTLKLSSLKADNYEAILFPGGHGPMWDLADNRESQKLTREIYEHGGVVAAVCHGPAGIVNVKLSNGKYLVEGKKVTGFSNDEEKAVELDKVVPFLLESSLIERGAKFEKAPLWQEKVVSDGHLITGQNPASAKGVGEAITKALQKKD
ncbi:MAG: type 1 glutamine amidotransferase domain-containing protein [Candidatus Obscuribacterales bacterium]|nr:type 1 glutamine amidotransferase domain-containing protein [Candidatus Obscuribacterales bacterium]